MARETIDQLARRLAESLPQSVKAARNDLEQNFRSILDAGLSRLDLVTREEFEVQEAVLARTRAKLEALESRLQTLEKPVSRATETGAGRKKTVKKAASRKKTTGKTAGKKKAASKASSKKTASARKKKKTATRK